MDIETGAGSDLAVTESNVTPAVENTAPAPSTSAREALEKAFQSVAGDEPKAERTRDDAGRFAPKAQEAAPAVTDGQETPEAPVAAPVAVPPPSRFAKAAQDAWATLPEVVRSEVVRLEGELTKGLSEYQQKWEPLKQFDEMARSGGTTLDKALNAYVGMENLIRSDPVAGLMMVCQNAGLDPVQIGQILAGQQPTGGASPEVASLKAEIAALKNEISGVGRSITQKDVMSQVEAFARENPHFDELSADIAQMIQTGFAKDLADAYGKAVRLNPEIAAKIEASKKPPEPPAPKQPDPAQTRKAALSITGSPASGSNPATRTPAGSTREALTRAFSQVGLS